MNECFRYISYTSERGCPVTLGPPGAGRGGIHFASNSPDCPASFWTLPGEAHPRGLTFVERCLTGLVGDVRLGPSLEQGLEAVQVSSACRQVKGRFLLQGALVNDGWVCWAGRTRKLIKRKIPTPTPNTEVVQFPPNPKDRYAWHLPEFSIQTAFILLALDSATFTGLWQLPGHINPAQMPPPLGSLPWLNSFFL